MIFFWWQRENIFKEYIFEGAWVTQLVEHLSLVQVMTLGSWDQAWSQVPCSLGSLFLPLLLPLQKKIMEFIQFIPIFNKIWHIIP